jgi:hypothetical protein
LAGCLELNAPSVPPPKRRKRRNTGKESVMANAGTVVTNRDGGEVDITALIRDVPPDDQRAWLDKNYPKWVKVTKTHVCCRNWLEMAERLDVKEATAAFEKLMAAEWK